ncbi:MAG: ABC transporter ATP-binding protein/permease [Alphaproteobacteria bacterium]|nr:ABC transporter ATP-binding protein/permease [Alphaproteobacteria bacterium]
MKESHDKPMGITDTLAFAWRIVRVRKPMFWTMLICAAMFSAVEVALPILGKTLFDGIAAFGSADSISIDMVWRLTFIFFGFHFAFWLFRYGMFYVWIPFSVAYIRELVQVGFERVLKFSTAWHNDTFTGVTVRNLTRGMWALDGILELCITQFFPTFLVILGTAIYLSVSGHPLMGGALAIFLVTFMAVTGTISLKIVAPLNQASNEADSRVGGLIADAVTCIAAIKAFGMEREEAARIREGMDVWQARKFKAWYAATGNGVLQTTLTFFLRVGFVFAAVYMWTKGQASLGDIFFVMSISAVINSYLRDFGSQLRTLQNHINDLDPVAAYMEMQPAITDAPDAPALAVTGGEIVFEDVTFGYKHGLAPLFSGLSITIPAGKTVALVGRSGSGKSSFIKLVQRLYDVQGGRILIDGQNVAGVTQESLHKSIALVPQDPVLFHRTLAENIAYARPDVPMGVIREAAHDANIDDFIMTLPEKYETLVGERGVKLSGGERQRVAIARAIVAQRPILVMDEATSSLDSVSEEAIQGALDRLTRGRTTLVIAHRLSTIRRADLILVFEEGRIVEQGPHEALLAQNATYRKLYDAQVGGLIV